MKYLLSIIAVALTLITLNSQAATINSDGTFTVGQTTWINDGNINYNSDDYSCLLNFGSPCSNQSVGITSYDVAVLVADAACVGCRLPTVDEFLALYNDDTSFLNLVPSATYWALDESGNPFLFGSPVFDLSTGTATRAVGLMGVMAVSAVPVPAAIWLFGSGLFWLGLVGRKSRKCKI